MVPTGSVTSCGGGVWRSRTKRKDREGLSMQLQALTFRRVRVKWGFFSYLQRRGRPLARVEVSWRPRRRGTREPGGKSPSPAPEEAWPTPPACPWLQHSGTRTSSACRRGSFTEKIKSNTFYIKNSGFIWAVATKKQLKNNVKQIQERRFILLRRQPSLSPRRCTFKYEWGKSAPVNCWRRTAAAPCSPFFFFC